MKSFSSYSTKSQFGNALSAARRAKKSPQEDFDQISSRTYVSALERGIKQPTVAKVDDLASVLKLHPLTLLALSYLMRPTSAAVQELLGRVAKEIEELELVSSARRK